VRRFRLQERSYRSKTVNTLSGLKKKLAEKKSRRRTSKGGAGKVRWEDGQGESAGEALSVKTPRGKKRTGPSVRPRSGSAKGKRKRKRVTENRTLMRKKGRGNCRTLNVRILNRTQDKKGGELRKGCRGKKGEQRLRADKKGGGGQTRRRSAERKNQKGSIGPEAGEKKERKGLVRR